MGETRDSINRSCKQVGIGSELRNCNESYNTLVDWLDR